MSVNKSLWVILTVFVFAESAFVDTLTKCKINDGDCQKVLLLKVIKDIAKTGVPELNIPPLDPITLQNVSVSVLDTIDITLVHGIVKGIKDCTINDFGTEIEDEHSFMELICDITVKGSYKVFSSNPIIKSLFGGDNVHGDGNGKIKIEKLYLRFDFYFFIQRRNGELYVKNKLDKPTTFKFDIKGKMHMSADKLFIGKKESSKVVTGIFNDNWRPLMTSFGKPFMDKAVLYVYEFLNIFYDNVPAKHFISDDLTPYARD